MSRYRCRCGCRQVRVQVLVWVMVQVQVQVRVQVRVQVKVQVRVQVRVRVQVQMQARMQAQHGPPWAASPGVPPSEMSVRGGRSARRASPANPRPAEGSRARGGAGRVALASGTQAAGWGSPRSA